MVRELSGRNPLNTLPFSAAKPVSRTIRTMPEAANRGSRSVQVNLASSVNDEGAQEAACRLEFNAIHQQRLRGRAS